MIYTDEALTRWWGTLSKQRQREILETMVEKANSDGFQKYAERILAEWRGNIDPTPKELVTIKRWDR